MNEIQRAKIVLKILNKTYPRIKVPLKSRNVFTLLVSVLLSAQCTDVNVNNVTKDIYPKYFKPEHFVKLGRKNIEKLIKKIGIFRIKAKSIYSLSKILIEKHKGKVPRTFEELEIPLTTVATDIINNKKIESNKGDLINAIKASIAIPGVLTPTYVNENLCVDGGLIDPVPLQSIVDMGSDITLAVNLYGLQSSEKDDNNYNIVDIVDRSAKIILNNVTHLSFKNNEPDILIEPPIDQFKGWDFHKSNDLIEIGYDTAKKILKENEELFS